ncbi:hypothetical protein MNV49_002019 [Pseudohyphozyma bogoriensis]|nr:hypothetical protein MNV49_002019 [Pseudohyphozyma bogoriensis]
MASTASTSAQPEFGDKGPPPDLSHRYKLKVKYLALQRKYNRAVQKRNDLTLEVGEKEAKKQRLQDEVDLIIDQIYDIDYQHLQPKDDDLFSGSEDDHDALGDDAARGDPNGKRKAADQNTSHLAGTEHGAGALNGHENGNGVAVGSNGHANGTVRKVDHEGSTTSPSASPRMIKRPRLLEEFNNNASPNGAGGAVPLPPHPQP